MKLYFIAVAVFILLMLGFAILDMIPEPHNVAEKIIVIVSSVAALGLPLWVGIFQYLKRKLKNG